MHTALLNRSSCVLAAICALSACSGPGTDESGASAAARADGWEVDFLDEFDTFDPANWQDQSIWVNDETHCYLPDARRKWATR
jgi:hypothetical protein